MHLRTFRNDIYFLVKFSPLAFNIAKGLNLYVPVYFFIFSSVNDTKRLFFSSMPAMQNRLWIVFTPPPPTFFTFGNYKFEKFYKITTCIVHKSTQINTPSDKAKLTKKAYLLILHRTCSDSGSQKANGFLGRRRSKEAVGVSLVKEKRSKANFAPTWWR